LEERKTVLRDILFLVLAALLEVGGDTLVRLGLRNGNWIGLGAGAAVLFFYGLSVNLPKWDFGRLMGVYIALFFVVAQGVAVAFFHEKPKMPVLVGGFLIILGGLLMTFWRPVEHRFPASVAPAPAQLEARE
jgi:drug/metabolite transporter superfamily protein YnfA